MHRENGFEAVGRTAFEAGLLAAGFLYDHDGAEQPVVIALDKVRTILKECAYLIAAMHDKELVADRSRYDLEVRDTLAALRKEMDAAGYLAPYESRDGELTI